MVDSVFLSPSQSFLVREIQRIAAAREESGNQLATGRVVNSISDAPQDFLRAQALSGEVATLNDVKGDISLSQNTLQASSLGLDAIEDFSRQLQGIASAAGSAGSQAERDAFAAQFDEIRNQINLLANDTTFLGRNLLAEPSADLTTQVGQNSTLTTSGNNINTTNLGVGDAASFNNFASVTDVNNAIAAIDSAVGTVRATQSDFSTDLAILNVREDFAQDLSNIFQDGIDQLVNADLNEAAAQQLSASVRGDLAITGQRILAQGDQLVLNLFN